MALRTRVKMPRNTSRIMSENNNDGQSDDWKIAEITIQSPGPRYVIRLDSGAHEAVDTVEFNGFKVGLDGRAEVEYRRLDIEDEDFTSTAKFYDHAQDSDKDNE